MRHIPHCVAIAVLVTCGPALAAQGFDANENKIGEAVWFPPDATVIRLADGSLRIAGGRAAPRKIEYDALHRVADPMNPSLLRIEIDIKDVAPEAQARLVTALNTFGYFATGMASQNAGVKQRYWLFDKRGTKIHETDAGAAVKSSGAAAPAIGLSVSKAWTQGTIRYSGPPVVPGSTGSDATMRASAGRTLLVVEIAFAGDRTTLNAPDVTVHDARGNAYEAIAAAGTSFDNVQPFAGVSGWVTTFGRQGPTGPLVKIGREKEQDPVRVEFTGNGATVFLVYPIPSNAGPLRITLGPQQIVPLTLGSPPSKSEAHARRTDAGSRGDR